MRKKVCQLRVRMAAAFSLACFATLMHALAYEPINDFGKADVSAANTFWNVSGYNGGSVCRAASAGMAAVIGARSSAFASTDDFDSRFYTRAATLGGKVRTDRPHGVTIIFY